MFGHKKPLALLVLLQFLTIASSTFAFGTENDPCAVALGQTDFKVQSRFQITNLAETPADILAAVQEGKPHHKIRRRGFVVQEYLLVNDDNVRDVITKINELGITFGTEESQMAFLSSGAAKEIRLMTKSIKVNDRRVELYQVTIKSDSESALAVRQLETPENLSDESVQALKSLFDALRPRVTDKARKAYFEFTPTDAAGQSLRRPNGTELSVAIDIFIAGNRHNPRPMAINGEVDFQGPSRDAAIADAQSWLAQRRNVPSFLTKDLIGVLGTKSRDYAIHGVPGFITEGLAPHQKTNGAILDAILAEYKTWAHPTIIDLALSEPEPSSQPPQELSFFRFVYNLIHVGGNIHDAMDRLERVYGGTEFAVDIPYIGRKIHVLQSRDSVASALKKKSRLVYVNRNFDLTHGHFNSINSVDTSDPLWEDLHFGLLEIFNNKKITPIMLRHKDTLLGNDQFNLNQALEDYFLKVWSEYMFGTVDTAEFTAMRNQLVNTLGKAFHTNPFNRLPGLGRATSYANYLRYRKEWEQVDEALARLLNISIQQKQGAFYELYERLRPKYDNAYQITLDNAFLGTLVYDFIYIIMMDATAHIAKFPDLDRKQQVQRSIHDAFLYPFRFRVAEEDGNTVKTGDFYLVNLQRSGHFFSYGARFCPGAKLFKEITKTYLEIMAPYSLCMKNPHLPIENTGNRDTPFTISTHDVVKTEYGCPFAAFRNGTAR